MPIKKLSVTLLAGIMLLSGCSRQELPNEISADSSSTTEISDPLNENSVPEAEKLPSVSYGFRFNDDCISVSNDGVVFSPTVKCGQNSTQVGIMIFIDGVEQKYSVGNAESQRYTTFNVKSGLEEKFDLKIDGALDVDLNEHYITIISMLAPDFKPSLDSPSFGNYHKCLGGTMKVPERLESILPSVKHKSLKAENSVLTQNLIEKYKIVKHDEDSIVEEIYLLQGDDRLEDHYVMSENESSIKLHFAAFTTDSRVEMRRVTFFVNHEPVKFNGDYEYLDYTMEGEKITEMDIEIENVKVGDFIYCISVPFSSDGIEHKCSSKMIVPSDGSASNN